MAKEREEITHFQERERTDLEVSQIKRDIAFLYRTFSEIYDTKVVPGSSWACGLGREGQKAFEKYIDGETESLDDLDLEVFRPKIFVYPEEALRTWSFPAILGATRHELGHAIHTDYRVLFKGQKQAIDEGFLPTTWATIWNANEDPWVNNREIADSLAARKNIEHLYQEVLPEVLENINSQPPMHQLGLNINHYWLTGEDIPTLKNEQVLGIFEEIKSDCESYFNGESPEENFETLQLKIWDKVKVLEEQGVKENMLKRVIESALGEEFGGQGRQGNQISRIIDSLRGDKKQSFDENLQKKIPANLKEKLQDEIEKQTPQTQKGASGDSDSISEAAPRERKVIDDIDLSKINERVREELEKVIDSLDKELLNQLENESVERLDEKQAEVLKKNLPVSLVPDEMEGGQYQIVPDFIDEKKLKRRIRQVESITEEVQRNEELEFRHREEIRNLSEEHLDEKAKKELFEYKMRQAGFDPEDDGSQEAYRQYLELERSIRPQINQFVDRFEKHLPKKTDIVYGGAHYSGPRTDWEAVSRKVPVGKYDFQNRSEIIEAPEARLFVWLILDRSRSMAGVKMHESLKTAIFFAESLESFNIPLSIDFFGESVESLLHLGEDFSDPRNRVKSKIMEKSDASGRWTDLGSALLKVKNEMAQGKRMFPKSFGSVYVISDGEANEGITGPVLRKTIENMQKSMRVYGFDLSGVGEIGWYFGEDNSVEVSDFSQIPAEAYTKLTRDLDIFAKRNISA